MAKNTSGYGSWKSPITADLITTESVSLDQVRIYRDTIFWLERRPTESGRSVIVSRHDHSTRDLIPPPFNARSRVHEYGGGVYCACEHGVYFVNDADQDIYLAANGAEPVRITRTGDRQRYADLCFDGGHNRILCVCEDHNAGGAEPVNSLVAIDTADASMTTLAHGHDFYSNPRISPDGRKLAWLCWNHPNMPWDGTELWLADIEASGLPGNAAHISGDDSTSVFQPEWSPDNILYFVSDASGWWNLVRLENDQAMTVTAMEAEFGLPQWVFGQATYAFCGHQQICCTYLTEGIGHLALLDVRTLALAELSIAYDSFSSICAHDKTVVVIAAAADKFAQVLEFETDHLEIEVIARSCATDIDDGYLSRGRSFSFTTRHADHAHAVYYPPVNKDYAAPAQELPPLIVICHGGPTGATDTALDLRKQYWTSRGFALVDVNYSGSTGYGRSYRDRLQRQWGKRDVDDVGDAALYLADTGIVDRDRLIIKGSSAGGYTVLAALTFKDIFACGASYYGISDLESLLADTHKFESHYTDGLVGEYPEQQQRYIDRSPINFVDRLSCPVIFFQGIEDRVVPASQAERMVAALKHKGIAVSYVAFENEQHGFRQAETIRTALLGELYFYSRIFGFEPADELPGIDIDNL